MNRNNVFLLSLSTFITIVAWIGFNIYHNFNTSTISETENIQIAPIKSDFDMQAIDEISKRKKVVPIFDAASSPATPSAEPGEPSIQPTQIPTQLTPTTIPLQTPGT